MGDRETDFSGEFSIRISRVTPVLTMKLSSEVLRCTDERGVLPPSASEFSSIILFPSIF